VDAHVIDLEQVCVVAVPMLNPYGYRNGTRLNANGVDLSRQLRKDWNTFRSWTDEVIEPWTFDFKGTARGDEPEAKIEARLLAEPNLICAVDAHAMTGGPVLGGSGPNENVVRAIARETVAKLKSRYLIRYLTDAAPRQLCRGHFPMSDGRCEIKV
jgi:hypothetical protein